MSRLAVARGNTNTNEICEGYFALLLSILGEPPSIMKNLSQEEKKNFIIVDGRVFRAKNEKYVDTDAYIRYIETGKWPGEEKIAINEENKENYQYTIDMFSVS